MKDNKEGSLSKQFWYIFVGISSVLIIIISIGMIVFANREEEVITKKETGGNLVLNYTGNNPSLTLTDIGRTTDTVGMKDLTASLQAITSCTNDAELDNAPSIEYEIAVIKDKSKCTISDSDIRIYLEQEKSGTYTKIFGPSKYIPLKKDSNLGTLEGSMVLAKVKKIKKSSDNYRLRIWLADTSALEKGNYSLDVVVNGKAK